MNTSASVSIEYKKKQNEAQTRMQNNLPSETVAVASQLIARNPVFLKLRFTLIFLNIFATLIETLNTNFDRTSYVQNNFPFPFNNALINCNSYWNRKPSLSYGLLAIITKKKIIQMIETSIQTKTQNFHWPENLYKNHKINRIIIKCQQTLSNLVRRLFYEQHQSKSKQRIPRKTEYKAVRVIVEINIYTIRVQW